MPYTSGRMVFPEVCVVLRSPIRSVLCMIVLLPAGCAPRITRLQLQEIDPSGHSGDFFQDFGECFYSLRPGGDLSIVLRFEAPATVDPRQTIRQVVHLRCFWQPRPGVTDAEESMINGSVCYVMQTGVTAISYEGGMFVSFKIDRRKKRITGKLESSELKPLRRRAGAQGPFGTLFAKGTFVGVEHPRRVTAILNEMERHLGVRPVYTPRRTPFVR